MREADTALFVFQKDGGTFMTRSDIIRQIEEEKLIVIVRGVPTAAISDTMEALYAGGVRLAEITFDASGIITDAETEESIRIAAETMRGRMVIGAGTVLSPAQVERTKRAGGCFIISPDTNPDVILRTRSLSMVSIPGAMTPSEITRANALGADFVKLFPAGSLGVSYFKAIRAPLSQVKLLAVAGITLENIPDFRSAGACGFGISSSIVKKELFKAGNFDEITALARQYTECIHTL